MERNGNVIRESIPTVNGMMTLVYHVKDNRIDIFIQQNGEPKLQNALHLQREWTLNEFIGFVNQKKAQEALKFKRLNKKSPSKKVTDEVEYLTI